MYVYNPRLWSFRTTSSSWSPRFRESASESEFEACPVLWRTIVKKAWAQRSYGPKGLIGVQETTQALLRGTAASTRGRVRLKDGVSCATAGGWSNARVLRNVFDTAAAIYHAEVIRGPSPMWSSTKTSVLKRAPNKIFLGLFGAVVPVLIRGLPPAW